jgi:hypothetical protein
LSWQLKLLLKNIDCSLGKKATSLRNNYFPRKNTCSKFFSMIIISCSFLYRLVTYHWKGLEDNYNYVVEGISIKIHMQKLCSNKVLDTFVPQGTWLLPRAYRWAWEENEHKLHQRATMFLSLGSKCVWNFVWS